VVRSRRTSVADTIIGAFGDATDDAVGSIIRPNAH
jgi:hypothetical protein